MPGQQIDPSWLEWCTLGEACLFVELGNFNPMSMGENEAHQTWTRIIAQEEGEQEKLQVDEICE